MYFILFSNNSKCPVFGPYCKHFPFFIGPLFNVVITSVAFSLAIVCFCHVLVSNFEICVFVHLGTSICIRMHLSSWGFGELSGWTRPLGCTHPLEDLVNFKVSSGWTFPFGCTHPHGFLSYPLDEPVHLDVLVHLDLVILRYPWDESIYLRTWLFQGIP